MMARDRTVWLLVLAAQLAGCCGGEPVERPPLAPPRASTAVRYAAGSPLGAGGSSVEPGTAANALEIRVTFFALEQLPEEVLGSLASQTRLTVNPVEEKPLLAAGTLAAQGRAGPLADARAFAEELAAHGGRVTRFADLRAALPEGVTATFESVRDGDAGGAAAASGACEPLHERFAVHVFRDAGPTAGAIEIALEIEDSHPAACSEGAPVRLRPDRELSCLERRGPGVFALVVRSPFHGDAAGAVAAIVEVRLADAPIGAAHADAFAACAGDLAREAVVARQRRSRWERPRTTPTPTAASSLEGLRDSSTRRATLIALARGGHATVAEEVALTGSEELVGHAARAVTAADGWIVERAAIGALRSVPGGEEPPAELAAIIARRAGAATWGTFFALAERAASLEALEELLVAENEDLLEDASPAIRVRAFEWLGQRGATPKGFDPLGPSAERRKALESTDPRGRLGDR